MKTESVVKHTPGVNPHRLKGWHVSGPVPTGYSARVFTECGAPVADIHRMVTDANEQGIARLIAAAPALLEALENTTQTLRLLLVPMDPIDADSRAEVRNEIELAETAIRLAKGGTQ